MDFIALTQSLDRTDRGGAADPYHNLAWLRAQCPVSNVPGPHGTGSVWLVTNYELARRCLADPRLSFDPTNAAVPRHPPGHEPYILARDAPAHTRLRRLVLDAFSPRNVAELAGAIRRICRDQLATFAGRDRVDLMADYAVPIPELVTYELFGVPDSERMTIGRGTELAILIALREQPMHGPATAELHAYIEHIIGYKRRHRGDDLPSRLLDRLDTGEVRDEAELEGMLYLLFATGQVSTAPLLGTALFRLLESAEPMSRLLVRSGGPRAAIDEALRHDSPVQTTMPRFALEDLEIGGQRVKRGDTVMISVAAANRDPDQFPEPDVYRVDRDHRTHLGFGVGPHFCLGAPLARREVEIAIELAAQRFPGIRLAVAPADIEWALSPVLRSPRTIPVTLRPPD